MSIVKKARRLSGKQPHEREKLAGMQRRRLHLASCLAFRRAKSGRESRERTGPASEEREHAERNKNIEARASEALRGWHGAIMGGAGCWVLRGRGGRGRGRGIQGQLLSGSIRSVGQLATLNAKC